MFLKGSTLINAAFRHQVSIKSSFFSHSICSLTHTCTFTLLGIPVKSPDCPVCVPHPQRCSDFLTVRIDLYKLFYSCAARNMCATKTHAIDSKAVGTTVATICTRTYIYVQLNLVPLNQHDSKLDDSRPAALKPVCPHS